MSDDTEPELTLSQPWRAGDTIGRYALLTPLARGGMAELWLARHAGPQSFEKLVVVKRILAAMEGTESLVHMFLDEARIVAQLNHPNIVQVIELGEHGNSYFIAMEYLHGESLAHFARAAVREGVTIPAAIAVRIIAEAAEGLGHAHARKDLTGKPLGIVHRDVSPQNVLVTYDGLVKVLDFGIAKATSRTTHTETGLMKGKLQYMAPEQARASRDVGPPADVFSLGVMLFELLTGTRLYGDAADVEILGRLISGDAFPRPRDRLSSVDPRLDRIVTKAMRLDPGSRHQDGRELASELTDWLHEQRTPSTAMDVEALVRTVLAERLRTRQALINKSLAGPPVNSVELTPGSRASLPGGTPYEGATVAISAPKRRRLPVLLIVAFMGVGIVGGVVLARAYLRSSQAPATAVVIARAPSVEPRVRAPVVTPVEPAQEVTPEPDASVPVGPMAAETPVPVVRAKKGLLRLETRPWTQVFLGNRALGDTPLLDVALPPGTHTLRLRNDDEKVDRRVEVEIRSGETTSLTLTL